MLPVSAVLFVLIEGVSSALAADGSAGRLAERAYTRQNPALGWVAAPKQRAGIHGPSAGRQAAHHLLGRFRSRGAGAWPTATPGAACSRLRTRTLCAALRINPEGLAKFGAEKLGEQQHLRARPDAQATIRTTCPSRASFRLFSASCRP
jgi:hypothetical protein